MYNSKTEILNYTRPELEKELFDRFGWAQFRARQIFPWLYKKRVVDFALMTNIAKEARLLLTENFAIFRPEQGKVLVSSDGSRKYLFKMRDGKSIESVLIRQPKRYTLCVSSQVGCAVKCSFCKTGTMGLVRNLEAYEIVAQALAVRDDIYSSFPDLIDTAQFPDYVNIVFMGMGEPLHNSANVIKAISILNDGLGLNFSGRKITVSTSGIIAGIDELAMSAAKANLALSLNATTNECRTKIMPINKRYPLEDLIPAIQRFPLSGRQRITIEYVLLKGVNDSSDDRKRLVKLLHGIPVKINLIPYNDATNLGYSSPSRDVITAWQDSLLSSGLNATIRWSKGDDISGACGQLVTSI